MNMRVIRNSLNENVVRLWNSYSNVINARTSSEKTSRSIGEIWKDRFFTEIVKFVLPTGSITLTASVIVEYRNNNHLTAVADILAFMSIILVVLNKKISIRFKKIFGMCILVAFSIMKITTLYSLMLGTIYLLVFSILATLLFSKRIAYLSVAINALICTGFTVAQMEGFPMHKLNILNSDISNRWTLFTLNIIFVNLLIVSVILYITNGFEKTIEKSEKLSAKLQLEIKEKIARQKLLQESTTHYKSLFFFNPFPILIYDPASLQLLNINKAAINRYGYPKLEFLKMKINVLANCDENEFKGRLQDDYAHQMDTHYDKNGGKIMADIHVSSIKLNGRWVRIAIVRDITAETDYIATIARKRKKMREIAYMQSHIIRNPLSQILGITQLIKAGPMENTDFEQSIKYLIISAEKLDVVVTDIIKQTE